MQYKQICFGGIFERISEKEINPIKREEPARSGKSCRLSMKKVYSQRLLPVCNYYTGKL